MESGEKDYNSGNGYYAAAVAPRLVPPLKRPRLMVAQTRSTSKNATTSAATSATQKTFTGQNSNPAGSTSTPAFAATTASAAAVSATTSSDRLKIYSNPDILICGNCREMFTELQELLEHKKNYCKLRFTCKCNVLNGVKPSNDRKDAAALLCVQCKDSFYSAWDLMVHVQAAHMINIYELGVPKCSNGTRHSSRSASPDDKNDPDEDALCHDDVRLADSPDSEKNKESDVELGDAMDVEGADSCSPQPTTQNHGDSGGAGANGTVPGPKRTNGRVFESE